MGAWIETYGKSHTMQSTLVAPYVGAWIETYDNTEGKGDIHVAPYVGAWIETVSSKLSPYYLDSRTLCGCVD